jgi:GT2 family glycosyltransferase
MPPSQKATEPPPLPCWRRSILDDRYTLTFACYNQLEYTKRFIASLDRTEVLWNRIAAVDNGSTDGTRQWLADQGFGAVILNQRNLGCGPAWNQGALAIQSEWTVVMNNDVVCAPGWLSRMLDVADRHKLKMISPAMIEGPFDYDLNAFVSGARDRMNGYLRRGVAHAVCVAIHQDVWDEIGYFLPIPRLMGLEDTIFFQRAWEAGIAAGTTSEAWLHHYGQTTQRSLKIEQKLSQRDSLGDRRLMHEYLRLSWWGRRLARKRRQSLQQQALAEELRLFGLSIHGTRLAHSDGFEWH